MARKRQKTTVSAKCFVTCAENIFGEELGGLLIK
jgi:hypothetical protein